MPVESLDAQAGANVPEGDRLVTAAGAKIVRGRLEGDVVDRVDMSTQCLAATGRVEVKYLGRVVHRRGDKEVALVVESAGPDGLGMVREGVRAAFLHHVPKLHRRVTARGRHNVPLRMELDVTYPVLVAFAAHDQLAIRTRPQLPGVVVTRRADNLQPRVERDARNRPEVALEGSLKTRVLRLERLELQAEVRVRPVLFWPWRVARLLAFRRNLQLLLVIVPLVLRLVLRDLLLQRLVLGGEAIALEAHEHLLLHRALILVPKLRKGRLVLFVMLLQPLEIRQKSVLLLHNSLVVHAVEVALLTELVPLRLRLRRDRARLLELHLVLRDLVEL